MRFMVSFRVTGAPEEIQPLVPAERARIAELRAEGTVESLELAADGDRGWIVMSTLDEDAARRALASLPMAQLLELDVVALRGT